MKLATFEILSTFFVNKLKLSISFSENEYVSSFRFSIRDLKVASRWLFFNKLSLFSMGQSQSFCLFKTLAKDEGCSCFISSNDTFLNLLNILFSAMILVINILLFLKQSNRIQFIPNIGTLANTVHTTEENLFVVFR